jgi:hypothetical protein
LHILAWNAPREHLDDTPTASLMPNQPKWVT